MLYLIEDEAHAEHVGQFATYDDAMHEIKRRAQLPWDSPENCAPCTSWRTCGRRYELVTYDETSKPWREVQREFVVTINATGSEWSTAD